MNVRNCRSCGRLFNHVMGLAICPACKEAKEAKFQEVKAYVQDHRNATMHEVKEACEVETNQIHQWIREERLEFSSDSPIRVPCEKCGVMMQSGRYCDKCKNDMTNNLNSAYAKPAAPVKEVKKPTSEKDRMRFLDK